jgi:4'-phosphopantetheinyl transferase EntD
MPVIEKILPGTVACAEAFTDSPDATLFPREAELVSRATDKRRREFTTGRECARVALGKLGVSPGPILRGERGAPLWPPGIIGSITHCAGYRAAAVARAGDLTAIGLDAEPNDPLPRGVLDVVSRPAERARLAALAGAELGVCWDRLLFCAKESVYKAWFPLTSRWLGFEDADVTIEPDGTFTARLLPAALSASAAALSASAAAESAPVAPSARPPVPGVARSPAGFAGRWLASSGLLVTAIAVPAGPEPGA